MLAEVPVVARRAHEADRKEFHYEATKLALTWVSFRRVDIFRVIFGGLSRR